MAVKAMGHRCVPTYGRASRGRRTHDGVLAYPQGFVEYSLRV